VKQLFLRLNFKKANSQTGENINWGVHCTDVSYVTRKWYRRVLEMFAYRR